VECDALKEVLQQKPGAQNNETAQSLFRRWQGLAS
jgi:hypothetical protein